jgi:hypothetical protein
MTEPNVKVIFTNVYFVGNVVGETDDQLIFNFLFMMAPMQDSLALVPFGIGQAKDEVEVNKSSIAGIADATPEMVKNWEKSVGDMKQKRSGIVLAPASAMANLPKQGQAGARPDVAKLM